MAAARFEFRPPVHRGHNRGMSGFHPSDWRRLRALRDRFLTDASEEYWTAGDLALYDATFAQRIGWKWDGVLRTLDRAGWTPQSQRLLDWGCGSGIAGRVAAEWAGIREAEVYDQSAAAMKFAVERFGAAGVQAKAGRHDAAPSDALLVISHVAGELTEQELAQLAKFAASAPEIIWVEPGSFEISRRLTAMHDVLQTAGHHLIAPCTHEAPCPMNGRERDWCHFFAGPPGGIFHLPFWQEFSRQLEIDLRALPYSFLAMSKHASPRWPDGAERLIGRPRALKGHCEVLCCGSQGLPTRTVQKRDMPELFRQLTREGAGGVFRWEVNPDRPHRVAGGEPLD